MPNNRNNILVDPRGEYYHDAYPAQQQEPPGLEGRMQPCPDTGEESYRGHGRLLGRKALITGGDSGIGRAAESYFRYAPEADKPALARRILRQAAEFGVEIRSETILRWAARTAKR